MLLETLKIREVIAVTATTTAQDVDIGYRKFLIQNNAANTVFVYFKEKNEDGVAATATNAFKLIGGDVLPIVFTAKTLSIIGSASAAVIIQIVE